jgi:hypothetical protein
MSTPQILGFTHFFSSNSHFSTQKLASINQILLTPTNQRLAVLWLGTIWIEVGWERRRNWVKFDVEWSSKLDQTEGRRSRRDLKFKIYKCGDYIHNLRSLSLSQGVRVSECQGVRVSGCKGVRKSGCQGVRVSGRQEVKVPGRHEVTKSGNQRVRESRNVAGKGVS